MAEQYTMVEKLYLDLTKILGDGARKGEEFAFTMDRVRDALKAYPTERYYDDKVKEQHIPATPRELFPPCVIGITGYTGSGKTTLANALKSAIHKAYANSDPNVIIRPFAQALKDDCLDMVWQLVDEVWDGQDAFTMTELRDLLDGAWKQDVGRPLYQAIGELRRKVQGQNAWINRVDSEVTHNPKAIFIVPDVRYPHSEAKFFQRHERGVLISTEYGDRRGEQILFPDHASEGDISLCRSMAHYLVQGDVQENELTDFCVEYVLPAILELLGRSPAKRKP